MKIVVGRWPLATATSPKMGVKVRTLVTFRSAKSNTTAAKPHYINPYSFGDDVAKWMIGGLKKNAIAAEEKLGPEVFSWYMLFGPDAINTILFWALTPVYWLGWLERQRGFGR